MLRRFLLREVWLRAILGCVLEAHYNPYKRARHI